jgi:methionyl-tRNA formyltransferase
VTARQDQYVVCTVKPWNIAAFNKRVPTLPGQWHLIEAPEQLFVAALEQIAPRYVFFPHWSWRVPGAITEKFECVCFHMADVPYGRGGSPLQNLIVRGHRSTMLSALRMVDELDAGPVYLKHSLSLEGRAEDIFVRAADLTYDLIAEIVAKKPQPAPQRGEVTTFTRRKPDDSALPQNGTSESLCDFIRMLDAPTYPKAFIDWGEWRLEFDRAHLSGEGVGAHVAIRKRSAP